MASKNLLVGVLLIWASGATLFAVIRRASFIPQCAYTTEEHLRKLSIVADKESVEIGTMNEHDSSADSMENTEILSTQKNNITKLNQTISSGSLIHKIPEHLQKYVLKIFQPKVDVAVEEFTMIMLTYKRVKMLSKLISHYCSAKRLQKILVIWNDVDSVIPHHILELNNSCQTRLEFVQEKENKLTNRFKPRPQIETDCVCIIDDDRLIDDIDDLEGAFIAWQSFRERIIGYEVRSYTLQKDGSFFYGQYDHTKPHPGYSIMGTGTAMLHKAYLEMFFDPKVLPKAMFDYVDKGRNCEDLAMNVLATKFLEDVSWHQPAALSYKHKGQIKNMEALAYEPGGHRGLSMRPDHYRKRTECLNKFAGFYGGRLPLHYSFLRVFNDKSMT